MATMVIDRLITEIRFIGMRRSMTQLRALDAAVTRTRMRLNTISGAAFQMGAAAALPLVGIAKTALTTDAALRRFQARTRASAHQMDLVKESSTQIGARLPLMTAEIIKAHTAFYQLGHSIDQALEAAPEISTFAAAAEFTGVEDAARHVSYAMNQFGLDVSEGARVLDMFLYAETRTPAYAYDIGKAFQYTGKTAAVLNLSMEELVSFLGIMAGSGSSAERSAQGLNAALNRISRSMAGIGRSKKIVAEAFEGLKIDMDWLRNLAGTEGWFTKFIHKIRSNIDEFGLDQETVIAAIGTLGGIEYASAITHAIYEAEKFTKVAEELAESSGEAMRQVEVLMNVGISGAGKALIALYDTLEVRLADAGLADPLEAIMRKLGEWIVWLTEANEEGELLRENWLRTIVTALKLGFSLLFLAAAAKGLSAIIGLGHGLMRMFGGAVSLTLLPLRLLRGLLVGTFRTLFRVVLGLFTPLKSLLWVMTTLGKTAAFMWLKVLGPVGWLIAVGALIYSAWTPIKTFFQGLWQGLVDGWYRVQDAARSLVDSLGPVGEGLRALFTEDATEQGRAFGDMIINFLVNVIAWVEEMMPRLIEMVETMILVFEMLVAIWEWLGKIGGSDVWRSIMGATKGIGGEDPWTGKKIGAYAGGPVGAYIGQWWDDLFGGDTATGTSGGTLNPIMGPVLTDVRNGLPSAGPPLPTTTNSTTNVSVSDVNVTVNAPGADSEEISDNVVDELRRQVHAAFMQADGQVK